MGIPSQRQYEDDERRRADADEQRINRATLRDRQEARAAFQEAMATDPAAVAERVAWLIDGNYGRGQYAVARQTVANPRLNREAILCQMVDYSGIDPRDARFVENVCEDIAKTASQIAQLARTAERR